MNKMINPAFTTILLTIGLLAGLSTTATADDRADARLNSEVNACASAFRDHIDLDGVHRIRHVVRKARPATIGRTLTFETSTWSGSDERRYEATCTVNGDNPPLELRVREVSA